MNVISINHKNAIIDVRNKISFSDDEAKKFCSMALKICNITECMLLSTCNRIEIYYVGHKDATLPLQKLISKFKNIDNDYLMNYYRVFYEENAIRHLYNVSCGIDSMILGEDEILHQLKHAFFLAQDNNTTGYELNTIIKGSISCAKKIKTETFLSKTPVSVGTLTANEIFNLDIENKTVLIIGVTGKIGTIVMKNLLSGKYINIIGTVRNHNSIFEYISNYPNVKFIDYHERYKYMNIADVIISATTSPHYTITKSRLLPELSMYKPRLFLDLAVPQDIDKSIEQTHNITLKNIDYFNILSKQNNITKHQEVEKAKSIIENEIGNISKELSIHEFLPYIDNLKNYIDKHGIENTLFKIKSQSDSQTFKNMLQYLKEMII